MAAYKARKNAKGKELRVKGSPGSSHGGREEPGWVYHLSQAKWHSHSLKESLMVKVAKSIEERDWTQTQAAKFLGVSQPRISDLMRGKTGNFTLDALVEMLYALDKPVMLVIDNNKNWVVSNSSPVSRELLIDSISYYSNAIKIDPRDSSAYYKRADAYAGLGQYELAIGDYTRCIELEPDRPGPRNQRALAYRDSGQYLAALQDCDELLRLFPGYNAYANRGLIFECMGEFEKALQDHSKAIALDPQRPGPHWNRGRLHEQLGMMEEALKDYEETLKVDPTYKIAYEAAESIRIKLSSNGLK